MIQERRGLWVSQTSAKAINAFMQSAVVDEANASLGLCRLHANTSIDQTLSHIQNDLFDLGADLAQPLEHKQKKMLRVHETQVTYLENKIDMMNAELSPLHSFVLPGGSVFSAHVHMARTLVRRAEREIIVLNEESQLNTYILKYINRLSDYLFVLSRYMNKCGEKDILWVPGQNHPLS